MLSRFSARGIPDGLSAATRLATIDSFEAFSMARSPISSTKQVLSPLCVTIISWISASSLTLYQESSSSLKKPEGKD